MIKIATIAGSDASGGAGLEADLKTFEEYGLYGMAAVTLVATMDPHNNWAHNIFSIEDDQKTIDVTDGLTKKLEIQANLFASKLLVPDESLCKKYILLHKQLGLRNFPFLHVDHQPVNKSNYHIITKKLSTDFNVSKEVVKNKLLALMLLTIDKSSGI